MVIGKATVTPTVSVSNKVYDTTTTASGAVNLTGVFSADAASASAVASAYRFNDANVGTAKAVTATGISLGSGLADNYVLSSTAATGAANITPAPLTVTANNAAKFVTQADTAGFAAYSVVGLLGAETQDSAGISAGVTVSRSNAGVNLAAVYSNVLVPSGSATIGNYALSYVPGTYTIVPAGQLLVQTSSSATTYGTAGNNPIASVSYLDAASNTINDLVLSSQAVVGGATVYTYSDGASGTVSFSAAPTGTTLSAGGRVNVGSYGLAAGNFSKTTNNLLSNTATVTGNLAVQPLAIAVSATAGTTTYDSTTKTQAYTSGALSGDAVTVSGVVGQVNAGSYGSHVSATGADVGNYSVTLADNNFTISPAALTLSGATKVATYSGATQTNNAATLSGLLGGDSFTVSGYAQGKNASVYSDALALTPVGASLLSNYTVTTTEGSLTVNKASASVTANGASLTYNGASQTTSGFSATGLVGGELASVLTGVTASRSAKNAGTYTTTASGTDSNYDLTFVDGAMVIGKANLAVDFVAANKVYDGNTSASLTASDNRFGGDVLTVSATGTFADKNVGAGKTVAVTGVVLAGADAANYRLASATSATTASITRLQQVTWVGGSAGSWFYPANWAGGAMPDLSNVASVNIPAGVTVSFDNAPVSPAQAGAVTIEALGSAGNLSMAAGVLNVGAGGITLSALTQSGGALSTSGSLAVASLTQTAGTLAAGRLSTTVGFSQMGMGRMDISGPVHIEATVAPVVLGNLSVAGELLVTSSAGAIMQSAGSALSVGGDVRVSASQNGSAANVLLGNAGNSLRADVTATGADVQLYTSGTLRAQVSASGDAALGSAGALLIRRSTARNLTLTSGGATDLDTVTVVGDLQVSTGNADITQSGPVVVRGSTQLDAGTGNIRLPDAGNDFGGTVKVTAASSTVTGTIATPERMDAPTFVVLPKLVQQHPPYQVTLVKSPDAVDGGVAHIELADTVGDAQIPLPKALQNWIAAAGAELRLEDADAIALKGVSLTEDGAFLRLAASANGRFPSQVVMRGPRGQMVLRIVKTL